MPSANNALIGALRVEATLDAGKFVDGARKIRTESKQTEASVKSSFSGIGAAVKAGVAGFVGAFSVRYFSSIIDQALKYAGSLGEVAQQLGVTTRDLQTFRFMAGQVGVSQEQLETGLSKLTITLGKVAAGAEAPTKALAAIGITAKDLANVDTGTAFRMISDGLQKVEDRSQRAAVEVALFGKTGSMLDNMLSGGSDRINELSNAAERLGIVLSDEQIRKADDTADKLEALKTVLSATIAGVVADNADAIYKLADSIAHLVSQIPNAIQSLKSFYASFLQFSANVTEKVDQAVESPFNRFNPLTMGMRGGQMHANRLANIQSDRALAQGILSQQGKDRFSSLFRRRPRAAVISDGSIDQFLAPKSHAARAKAKKGPADRSDETVAQFQREQMQADADILRAKQQLAHNSDDRARIELQLIDLERQMADAELDDRVRRAKRDNAEGRITDDTLRQAEAQADVLRAKNTAASRLKAQAVIDERVHQQKEDEAHLFDVSLDLQQDALRAQEQLATTASERRDVELRLLDLSERQERARLEAVIADEQSSKAAKAEAQQRLAALSANHAAARASVLQNTRNPLEEWAASIPQTAAQVNEALQTIQVEGFEGLSDAISDVITGTRSLKEAFGELAKSVIADIIRMSVRMLIFRAVSSIFGSVFGGSGLGQSVYPVSGGVDPLAALPGFASGGSFKVLGRLGTDRNVLSLNGLPMAKVSHNERISVANDYEGGGGITVYQTISPNFAGNAATHEDVARMAALTKAVTLEAFKDQRRRA